MTHTDARPGMLTPDGVLGAEYVACDGPCDVCLPFATVQDAAWVTAIRAQLATDTVHAPRPREPKPKPVGRTRSEAASQRVRKHRDRSPLLRLLSTERWTTSDEIAAQLGLKPDTVRHVLQAAQRRGFPIVSTRRGYRLTEAMAS